MKKRIAGIAAINVTDVEVELAELFARLQRRIGQEHELEV